MTDNTTDSVNSVNELTQTAKDVFYVAVGFSILGFQRAQVHRREAQRLLEDPERGLVAQVAGVSSEVVRRLEELLPDASQTAGH